MSQTSPPVKGYFPTHLKRTLRVRCGHADRRWHGNPSGIPTTQVALRGTGQRVIPIFPLVRMLGDVHIVRVTVHGMDGIPRANEGVKHIFRS